LNAQQAFAPVALFSTAMLSIVTLATYLVVISVTAPIVLALFAGVALVVSVIFTPLRRANQRNSMRAAEHVRDLQLTATTYVQLNKELHVFGVTGEAAGILAGVNRLAYNAQRRVRVLQRMLPSIYQQTMLLTVVGLVSTARAVNLSAAQFSVAALLALRSLTYVQQLNTVTSVFAENRAYVVELVDAVGEQRRQRTERGGSPLEPVRELTLSGVGFSYGEARALESVSLSLKAGDWLGVVGPSGSGKSTLASIIARLVRPTCGTYSVNGQPAETFDRESWSKEFAIVSQEPVLLRASAAENIAFHREATSQTVREAASLAAIATELDRLPQGFDTALGDGQGNLSGGQRQRVALARALLNHPSCLILDEPTSALDSANARLIEESLKSVDPSTIVIVVSHRPGLLRFCHRVLVLGNGRVEYDGPPDDGRLERFLGGQGEGTLASR
jgi:ABC-type multidrug transport system fused ATPase/permease subunit